MCVWTSQSANQAGSEGDKISRSLTQSTERLRMQEEREKEDPEARGQREKRIGVTTELFPS